MKYIDLLFYTKYVIINIVDMYAYVVQKKKGMYRLYVFSQNIDK